MNHPVFTPALPSLPTLRQPRAALRSIALLGFALACAALIGAAPPAVAQQAGSDLQSYDVELIIFRTLSSSATPETWEVEADAPATLSLPEDELSPFEAPPPTSLSSAAFPALPPSQFKLDAIAGTLRRSRDYRPLAHFGWTQPGYARNAAQVLTIDSLVPADSGLSGQIALTRGRYLHLTLNLAYRQPASETGAGQRFVLQQTRRMRSNERHYIDHPNFGVIVLITPSPAP